MPFSQRKRIKKDLKKDVALHFYMHDKDFSDFLQHPEKYVYFEEWTHLVHSEEGKSLLISKE